MAEHLFRKMLKDEKIEGVSVESAGISPAAWLALPKEAREALRLEGVGEIAHSPRGLSQDKIESADLILVMEERHKETITLQYPQAAGKVFLLKSHVGIKDGAEEILDPIGQSQQVYQTTLEEIKKALSRLIYRLKERNL